MCAAIGLSFTGCEPRHLKDPDVQEDGIPEVEEAPDPLIGQWRSVDVDYYHEGMLTQTVTLEMTIEDDLTGAVAASIHYDLPGTKYDEDYDYMMTLTAEALGNARYRIPFLDPDEPGHPGAVMTCTLTGDTLVCAPDYDASDTLSFEREV